MKRIEHFVPGIPHEHRGFVPHLRWPIPAGVAEAYATAYTEPGDQVLVPYCQGPSVVREILAAGRQPLAVNFDPLLVLLVGTELATPQQRELDAAMARLGDSTKQGMTLRRYLLGLYATTCPACSRPAVADYFVWDKELGQPMAKYVRCRACDWDGQAAMEPEDWERMGEVADQGMHYHYVLDRISPPQRRGTLRARLEFLLELYSPRNLYALAELTLKIDSLPPEGALQGALQVLLLDCLDRCSFLTPLPSSRARRRGLARPGRFVERNVWYAFEEAAARLLAVAKKPVTDLAGTLEAYLAPDGDWAGCLSAGRVRELARTLPPRSQRLILTSPPPLDSSVWSLSYLWGAWLLGAEAASPLRSLIRQRTPDPAWYARVMAASMATLADLLRDDGRLVLVLTGQRRTVVEALVLAAAQARLGVTSLVQRGGDYRLELAASYPQPAAPARGELEARLRQAAVAAAADTIRARGEPASWPILHAAIYQRLAEEGWLERATEAGEPDPSPLDLIAEQVGAARDDPVFLLTRAVEAGEELWWLADPGDLAPPLCDRVEAAAYQLLQDVLALTEVEFAGRVYAQFPGGLTPDAGLVAACLRAYGSQPTPDYWQLRQEDLPAARRAEQGAIVESLLTLGQRLGYRAGVQEPFDAAWFEGQQVRAVFAVRWQALVNEVLALGEPMAGARPYLVIPGGRAALVSYKLAHNPLWQQAVDEHGWWFIKYRHVRQLVDRPEVDEYALRTIVGLDPIVERETAQLPLF
ncbi:MAG: hypothetical protein PVG56_08905 [Anaerolineae bacterium]|jgi:hypothetical protein